MRTALFVLAAFVAQGCALEDPLGTVAAIVTAPITAPIMFVSARMHGREDFLERARRNHRPLPPIDAVSSVLARATLEQALERGAIDHGFFWQNDEDASGSAGGAVTVLETGRKEDGRVCRKALIETAMEHRQTDQRMRTYCRDDTGWAAVEGVPKSVGSSGDGNLDPGPDSQTP